MNCALWSLALLALAVQPPEGGPEMLPRPSFRQAEPAQMPANGWPAEQDEWAHMPLDKGGKHSHHDSGEWSDSGGCCRLCVLSHRIRSRVQTIRARSMSRLGLGTGAHGPGAWHDWWCSSCDLSQHAVQTPAHGYYHFHPYHLFDLESQVVFATSWGGDRRNPYDNSVLKDVYARWESEQDDSTGTTEEQSPDVPRPPLPRPYDPAGLPHLPAPFPAPPESRSSTNGPATYLNAPLLGRQGR